jgi:hypothetical protein
LPPKGHLATSGGFTACLNCGGWVPTGGKLLNILRCSRQPPTYNQD